MPSKQSTILDSQGLPFLNTTANDIEQSASLSAMGIDAVSISQVLAASQNPARQRFDIYQSYAYMMGDPIIATALNLHVTQSLGAHETTSEVFFIEANADATPAEVKIIEELQDILTEQINHSAYQLSYLATGYGDAYARIYGKEGKGVQKIHIDDVLLPPLVQPMVCAGVDAGYVLSLEGSKDAALTNMQLARFKMPRMGFVPQQRMLYNAWQANLLNDDWENHKPLPDTIGGSFLQDAERPFFLLQNALMGLSSSRILDAVREALVTINMDGMTEDQQKEMYNNVLGILQTSKARVASAIKNNRPITEKIMHILPVHSDKQMMSVDNGAMSGAGNAIGYSTEDVMFYAKMLAAVLGHDLSMLGFSEILSGGLGEGGFYRVSAQSAQRAIMIRQGFTNFVNHIIDVHCQLKYGGVFKKRPYEITFIGAQSALEKEKQDTQERRSVAASTVLQAFTQLKDVGFDEKASSNFMRRQMNMDEDDALMYAQALANNLDKGETE
ncbi:hypothetical protein [Vitreoscilla stercoraria]|uniref:Phage portal protein n=1 Tax=Vitreoscilla stercoraria TaxID=61 RepID=A0ABY4EDB4_VITST|nr:hypothetical protein [Vitreoscilla stercoraria]UOO93410.1 hypothetical protein LVJ81_05110 [Vitreoscilla stercoraria]